MFSTIVLAAIFLWLPFFVVVQWAYFLRLGLRWAKVTDVTLRRVIQTTLVVYGLQTALNFFFLSMSPSTVSIAYALILCELAATILMPCAVISWFFNAPFKRAIHIESGSIWIDGVRQTPPAEIAGIEYVTELPLIGPIPSGSVQAPALLSKDEYFVLGDFSLQSSDSRMWTAGSPGYHRYAVPKQNILGVVTHTFWPLHRWRVFR